MNRYRKLEFNLVLFWVAFILRSNELEAASIDVWVRESINVSIGVVSIGLLLFVALLFLAFKNRIYNDLARRRLVEKGLEFSKRRYKRLYEDTPAMLLSFDYKRRILSVSNKWLENTGYEVSDVIGKPFTDFMTETSMMYFQAEILQEYEKTGIIDNAKCQFVKENGVTMEILLSATSEKDRNGKIIRSLAYLNNITQQLETERALRQSEERVLNQLSELDQVYNLSPVGLALIDLDFRYVRINEVLAKYHNVPVKDHIGKGVEETVPELAPELIKIYESIIETGQPRLNVAIHSRARTKPGKEMHWIGNYHPLKSKSGSVEGIVAAVVEITEQKKVEKDLRKAKEEAEAANIAKGRFLANMSHEIKTPLNSIIGFSQILINKSQTYSLPSEALNYLNNIKLSGFDLSKLIGNLLEFSKIESEEQPLKLESIQLKELIQYVYDLNRTAAENSNIYLSYVIAPSLPEYFESDRTRLNHILINLIGNAIKFTPEERKVLIRAYPENSWMVLEVEDEGVGIPEKQLNLIFEAFEQGDMSSTRKFGGSGLGLSIVKKQLEILGGKIDLKSQEGVGTIVSVRIPLVAAEKIGYSTESNGYDEVLYSRSNKVLVVEDSIVNQELMVAFFKDYDFEAYVAEDGEQGLVRCKEIDPDLVFMDLHMPNMSGFEAIKEIRTLDAHKNTPIIALSADTASDKKQKAFDAGFTDYISKPFDFDDLIPFLDKYLKKESISEEKDTGHQELPDDVSEKLKIEIEKLRNTPRDFSNQLLEQIDVIRSILEPYHSNLLENILEIENAVYECDNGKIDRLLETQFS